MSKFSFTDEVGIWMRVTEYVHPSSNMPSITLLPMIHIGEKEFFREMNNEMWRQDTVFLEGCYMPGRKIFHLFHRSIGWFSKLSLQSGKLSFLKKWKKESKTQGQDGLTEVVAKTRCDCGDCYYDELRKVRADLHRWHALEAFKTIPFWVKLTFPFLVIAAIFAAPFLNLRNYSFDEDEDEDDSEEEPDFFSKTIDPIFKFILEDRDLFLRMILAEEILRPRHNGKRLSVKYGAKHMPALAETFMKDFGYKIANQRDVLAVKKVKGMDVSDIKTGYGYATEKYWEEMDAKKAQAKKLLAELLDSKDKNLISVRVRSENDTSPIPLSIQTDLSGFVDSITPAKAA